MIVEYNSSMLKDSLKELFNESFSILIFLIDPPKERGKGRKREKDKAKAIDRSLY